jgi:hypothetical protein
MTRPAKDLQPGPLTVADELRARFLEEIQSLDAQQWLSIGRSFAANEAAREASRKRIANLISRLISGQLATVKGFQERTIAFNRWAHARLLAAIEKLPETMDADGQVFPLRSAAMTAAQVADWVLRIFEKGFADKRALDLAAPALRPFEGFVTLPLLPTDRGLPSPSPAAQRKAKTGAVDSEPDTFHIRFPEDYFTFDEPPPKGVKVPPLNWNRRSTHHETWNLPERADLACKFGGKQKGVCAICGGGLHHLITLPQIPGRAFGTIGSLTIATCLSCLGWSEPVLSFEHDAAAAPRATGFTGSRRAPEFLAQGLRPATVHLSATPARWKRQRWEDADGQNLNRVGGRPTWIQDPEMFKCPRCRKRMTFLLQLDSELPTLDGQRWRWGSGGVLFVFWCGSCRIDSQTWQCT